MSIPLWITIKLGEIVLDTQPGFAQRPNQGNIGVPQLRTNNISREGDLDLSDISYVNADDSMIKKYGVLRGDIIFNNTNSPELVGKTAYFDIDTTWVISNHMTRIRVDPDLVDAEYLSRYLHYLWQTGRAKQWAKQWVNQAAIDQQSLRKFDVPLPPLPEQRRIAAILRQADMLRQWRRDANKKARELEKALFYEMFGNPISNPRGWPKKPFEKVCDSHLGKMLDKKQQTGKHVRPYLRNINIQWGFIDLFELVTMDFDEEDRRKFRLKKSDVLICEGGEVGRAAIWEDQIEECYFQKALHRARPYEGEATSEYVMYLLWALAENNGFQGIASPMTIPHLTGEKLKALEVPAPPFPLQQEFTRRVQQFNNIAANQKNSTEKLIDLFSSIAFHAFTGKLTASWRERHKEELQRAAVERDKKLGLRGEVPTLKDFEEGRVTPEEMEPLRQALGQFAVNVKILAEPMQQSMLESAKTLLAVYQDIVDPLLQNIRQSMQATASVLSERIQPISRENFLQYIDNLPVPQDKRAIIETLDTTTIQVLKLAGTYPAYFTADDLEAGELGGITTLQAEGSLRTLQALGFVKLVQIDGLLRYRLTDEDDYADLPSSLSVQS